MKTNLYVVYDTVSETTVSPLFSASRDEAAIRSFTEMMTDQRHPLSKHARDLHLIYVGQIDHATCAIFPRVVGMDRRVIYSGLTGDSAVRTDAGTPGADDNNAPAIPTPALALSSH